MAYTAQPGAALNVEGSFNTFFNTQLTGKGLPAFMPSAVVNANWPQQPLTYPSFSIVHMGSEAVEPTEGRHLDPGFQGQKRMGLAEISCWESYQRASGNHVANMLIMRDMAARVFATGAYMPILDVYGTTVNPTGNGTIIRANPVNEVVVEQDPNPDVLRKRLLVQYSWYERVSNT